MLVKSFSKNRAVCEIMYVKYGKSAQATDGSTVRRMACACWISKTTNTHSDYVIFNSFYRKICYKTRLTVTLYAH